MNFNFHEDLARIRVNEALRKGLASQRAHRSRSKKSMPSIKTIILKFSQA